MSINSTMMADIPAVANAPTSNIEAAKEILNKAIETYAAALIAEDVHLDTGIYKLTESELNGTLIPFLLKQTGGNQSKAARMAGLSRGTLRKIMDDLGLLKSSE